MDNNPLDSSNEQKQRIQQVQQTEQENRIKKKILDDLEETYHGIERRRSSLNKPKLISSIDRWGPGFISLLTLLAVILIGWTYGERISKLEGIYLEMRREVSDHHNQINNSSCNDQSLQDVKNQVEVYRVYVETLRSSMIARGIKVEPLPDLTFKPDKQKQGQQKQ